MGGDLKLDKVEDKLDKILHVMQLYYQQEKIMAGELANLQQLVATVVQTLNAANTAIQALEAKLAAAQNDSAQLQALIDQLTPANAATQQTVSSVPA